MAQSQSDSNENRAKDGSVKVHIGPEVVCDDIENVRNEIKFNCCKCTSKKVNLKKLLCRHYALNAFRILFPSHLASVLEPSLTVMCAAVWTALQRQQSLQINPSNYFSQSVLWQSLLEAFQQVTYVLL